MRKGDCFVMMEHLLDPRHHLVRALVDQVLLRLVVAAENVHALEAEHRRELLLCDTAAVVALDRRIRAPDGGHGLVDARRRRRRVNVEVVGEDVLVIVVEVAADVDDLQLGVHDELLTGLSLLVEVLQVFEAAAVAAIARFLVRRLVVAVQAAL